MKDTKRITKDANKLMKTKLLILLIGIAFVECSPEQNNEVEDSSLGVSTKNNEIKEFMIDFYSGLELDITIPINDFDIDSTDIKKAEVLYFEKAGRSHKVMNLNYKNYTITYNMVHNESTILLFEQIFNGKVEGFQIIEGEIVNNPPSSDFEDYKFQFDMTYADTVSFSKGYYQYTQCYFPLTFIESVTQSKDYN